MQAELGLCYDLYIHIYLGLCYDTVKPVLSSHSKDQTLVFKIDFYLIKVKSIAECSKGEHSAILLTCIKR